MNECARQERIRQCKRLSDTSFIAGAWFLAGNSVEIVQSVCKRNNIDEAVSDRISHDVRNLFVDFINDIEKRNGIV